MNTNDPLQLLTYLRRVQQIVPSSEEFRTQHAELVSQNLALEAICRLLYLQGHQEAAGAINDLIIDRLMEERWLDRQIVAANQLQRQIEELEDSLVQAWRKSPPVIVFNDPDLMIDC